MSSLVEETGQAGEPISLELAKNHLRVTNSSEDAVIKLYMKAARELLEDVTNLSFMTKSYRQTFDSFPFRSSDSSGDFFNYGRAGQGSTLPNLSQEMKLAKSPLVHVSRISYISLETSASADLFPVPFLWAASEEYSLGDEIADPAGNLQEVTVATAPSGGVQPTSGDTIPTFGDGVDDTTDDKDLVWTCRGTAPVGDFVYDRDSLPPRVFPLLGQRWPHTFRTPGAIRIYFEAGYGESADDIPARALAAILQIAGNWYENRETVTAADLKEIPNQFKTLVTSLEIKEF